MSLILGFGSNLGDRQQHIYNAIHELTKLYKLIKISSLYESSAVDYEEQPDFLNCVAEFKLPELSPKQFMIQILDIEKKLGRMRNISKGPRIIDIDILFWSTESINDDNLIVPHPRWHKRSFVVYPLSELPFFQTLKKCFKIPDTFDNDAKAYTPTE